MILSRLQRLGRREKIILVLAIVALVLWLLDFLVVRPLWGHIEALDDEIRGAQLTLDYHERALQRREKLDREYASVRDTIGETTTRAQDIERLTAQVDALARSTGVNIPSMGGISPPGDDDDPYTEYVVEVRSLECDLDSFLTFLYECPRQPGLLRVQTLSVAPNEDSGLLEGSIRVTKVMLKPLGGAE